MRQLAIQKLVRRLCLVLLAGLFLSFTTLSADDSAHEQLSEVTTSLEEMLVQTRDAFVVIEVVGTQKFIQFYSETDGLYIDMPSVSLSVDENKRADIFFRKYAVPQVAEEATDPETGEDFTLIVWRKAFDKDNPRSVAKLSLEAMIEIYQLKPDFKLTIYKGWK